MPVTSNKLRGFAEGWRTLADECGGALAQPDLFISEPMFNPLCFAFECVKLMLAMRQDMPFVDVFPEFARRPISTQRIE